MSLLLIAAFFIFQNGTCTPYARSDIEGDPTTAKSNAPVIVPTATPTSLLISPQSATLVVNSPLRLWVSGGTPPYQTKIIGGAEYGRLSADGIFIATQGAGDVVIEATDAQERNARATLHMDYDSTPHAPFDIHGFKKCVPINQSVNLLITGGTGPYTSTILSGHGLIDEQGKFTAGSVGGTSTTIEFRDANQTPAQVVMKTCEASASNRAPASSSPKAYFTTVTYPKVITCNSNAELTITNFSTETMTVYPNTLRLMGYTTGTDYTPSTTPVLTTCGSELGIKASCSIVIKNTGIHLSSMNHVATVDVSVKAKFGDSNHLETVNEQYYSNGKTTSGAYITFGSCN